MEIGIYTGLMAKELCNFVILWFFFLNFQSMNETTGCREYSRTSSLQWNFEFNSFALIFFWSVKQRRHLIFPLFDYESKIIYFDYWSKIYLSF